MPADSDPHQHRLSLVVLLLLAAGGAYLLGALLWPFLPAIVTSAVAAALSYPLHVRIRDLVHNRDIAAFTTTALLFFLVLVPAAALSLALVGEIRAGLDWLGELAAGAATPGGVLQRYWGAIADYIGLDRGEISGSVTEQLRAFIGLLARRTLRFLSGLGGWALQAGAALFTLFYLLRDGEKLLETLVWLVPLEQSATERLVDQARDVIFATVYGNVVIALVQGALGGLAFWVLGLPAAALWGSAMALLSLLPVVGAFLVWAPAGAVLLITGQAVEGIGLLLFGAFIISTVDNYLRALLVGGRAHLHPLVVFFSVLGGLVLFGAVGIFLGPVLFVVALSLIEMARTALGSSEIIEAMPATDHPVTTSLFRASPDKSATEELAEAGDSAGASAANET